MIKVIATPPLQWDEISKQFGLVWRGNFAITYAGEIYSPAGKVRPDVYVHELVHVEQQRGQDMTELIRRYMTEPAFVREVETPAFKAQAAFIDATMSPNEAWCRKYQLAKVMNRMYKGAFTMETASGIMNL